MITFLLRAGFLALLSSNTIADVDMQCMSDCTSRNYSHDYCSQRCSYNKGAAGSGGYNPEGALGAFYKGQEQANRDMLQQLQILRQAQENRAEADRQKRDRERYEQDQQLRAEQRQRHEQNLATERAIIERAQQLRSSIEVRKVSKKHAAPAPNSNFEKGMLLSKNNGDPKKMFSLFQKAASEGYAPAQYLVGSFFADGLAVGQSESEAIRWYRKSAEQDYPLAQQALGDAYLSGKGVEKNITEGFRLTRYAAENGVLKAQFTLSSLYANGAGVSQNEIEAHAWIRVSAESGYPPAQRILGKVYLTGMGVRKDERQGFDWLEKAAKQGDSEALSIMRQALLK